MSDQAEAEHRDPEERTTDDDHLAGVDAGAGCTEIWEHLSERRNGDDDAEE